MNFCVYSIYLEVVSFIGIGFLYFAVHVWQITLTHTYTHPVQTKFFFIYFIWKKSLMGFSRWDIDRRIYLILANTRAETKKKEYNVKTYCAGSFYFLFHLNFSTFCIWYGSSFGIGPDKLTIQTCMHIMPHQNDTAKWYGKQELIITHKMRKNGEQKSCDYEFCVREKEIRIERKLEMKKWATTKN